MESLAALAALPFLVWGCVTYRHMSLAPGGPKPSFTSGGGTTYQHTSSLLTSEVVSIEGTPTELLHTKGDSDSLVVVFPGNPGSPKFYAQLVEEIHALSGEKRQRACVVGHAYHSCASATGSPTAPKYFDLKEQMEHKLASLRFLLNRNPPGTKLILMGHSVGAWCVVQAMREYPGEDSAIAQGILLFPTVHNIGSSPNGVRLLPLMQFGRWALAAAAVLVQSLPLGLQEAIARSQLPKGATPCTVEAALSIVHPCVGANALWMALNEMRDIKELDEELAMAVGPKIVAYFGEGDPWNRPGDHLKCQAWFGPKANVVLCNEGHPHGFVLHPKSVSSVAKKCWGWISRAVR